MRSKKLGRRTVDGIKQDQKTKKKNTLEAKLPEGMSISKYEDTGRLSKSEVEKRRKK